MAGTYYETNRVAGLIFMLVLCVVFYLAIYMTKKAAEKKGQDITCLACANRGGDYRPHNCKNCHCKFYR